ncbi:hypothetical protein GAO09_12450 [Rhizobiales bacterium RZME27]|uniref:Uncharacterized protein n=1 Tax=Endobacterium cereale TaxID=2663029 RepID=A0A6A8ADL9_9HYPH|nr:hypothetical protein [Endobacterium cereale]MEB2847822.1 hypothetical protein [Endobacterium cereale]MQY46841.1 hypothetical protein [Endobacterium cereale]
MNVLKAHLGMVYVAILVMIVASIPMLRETRHIRSLEGWPTGINQQHRGFSG